jgi:rhodanese-related sulfurtransferase
MDWIIVAITVILLVAYIFLRRKGQIPAETAIAYLKQGTIVIDVRNPVEYGAGHLKGAINIPLPQIDSLIVTQVKDKNQVLLLH